MRVLLVTQYFHPEQFRVNGLADLLERFGHQVVVVTGKPNYPSGVIHEAHRRGRFRVTVEAYGESVVVIRVPIVPRASGSVVAMALNYVTFPVSAATLAFRRIWQLRGTIDVILTYQLSPVFMAIPTSVFKRILQVRSVLWIFDLWPESFQENGVGGKTILRIVSAVTSWIYRDNDQILVQSPAFVDLVQERLGEQAQVDYLPSWGEDDFLDSCEPTSLPGKGFRIVFTGNVGEAQGMECMLRAALKARATIPRITWIVVGDGRGLERMQQLSQALGLTGVVHFVGRVDISEIPPILAAADALYVGLKGGGRVASTIPGKLQAYLASGKPILAALDGYPAALIEANAIGFAVSPDDSEALAAAAVALSVESEERLRQRGLRGQELYRRNFAEKSVMEKLERILLAHTPEESD